MSHKKVSCGVGNIRSQSCLGNENLSKTFKILAAKIAMFMGRTTEIVIFTHEDD